MDDERACLPGFSARQGESEVHDVMCTLMEMGLGRASPLALSAAGCSDRKKGSPPGDGGVKAFYRHLLGQ